MAMEFQSWKLFVQNKKGRLELQDGNGKVLRKQEIPYTDFPLKEINLYLTDNVLLLPSEY